jgi:hypothetical protein
MLDCASDRRTKHSQCPQGYPVDAVAQTKRVFPDVMDLETWARKALSRD